MSTLLLMDRQFLPMPKDGKLDALMGRLIDVPPFRGFGSGRGKFTVGLPLPSQFQLLCAIRTAIILKGC